MPIPTMTLSGHAFVRNGDLWVSRAPFTRTEWDSSTKAMETEHKRFGVLTETRAGGKVSYSLQYLSTLASLRDTFGSDRVGSKFGGPKGVIYNDDYRVAAFEFFLLHMHETTDRTLPMTSVSYFHALGMCLAIGADLMTVDQYAKVVSGRDGKRKHATPNGELRGPNGEEYVVSSIERPKFQSINVDDPVYPTDPETGTRHYTGNIWKWMRRDPNETYQFRLRGGSCMEHDPSEFTASYDGLDIFVRPHESSHEIGFLAAAPAAEGLN